MKLSIERPHSFGFRISRPRIVTLCHIVSPTLLKNLPVAAQGKLFAVPFQPIIHPHSQKAHRLVQTNLQFTGTCRSELDLASLSRAHGTIHTRRSDLVFIGYSHAARSSSVNFALHCIDVVIKLFPHLNPGPQETKSPALQPRSLLPA